MTEIIDDILKIKEEDNAKEKRMTFSLQMLENQFMKMESDTNVNNEEAKVSKDKPANEKISSIPNMLKCYICEDFCDDAVQIFCCYENFCDKHIKEEIMKNFTCPNCKVAATLKDIVPNKKLREIIFWFKELTSDNTINIQNQNIANNMPSSYNINQNLLNTMKVYNSANKPSNLINPPMTNMGASALASSNQANAISYEKDLSANAQPGVQPSVNMGETGKTIFTRENLIDEKLNLLKNATQNLNNVKAQNIGLNNPSSLNPNFPSSNILAFSDEKIRKKSNVSSDFINTSMDNAKDKEAFPDKKTNEIYHKNLNTMENIPSGNTQDNLKNEINKIEFKKETNMTPEEKMQLYNKINSDSSHSGSMRKHSEDINENTSQKGVINKPMMPAQPNMTYPFSMYNMYMKQGDGNMFMMNRMYDPRYYMAMMNGMAGMMSGMPMPKMGSMMHPNMQHFQQNQSNNDNDSDDSDESSNSSSSIRKKRRNKKHSRSRENKRSKNKEEKDKSHHKKDKNKDKEKEKNKDKDKEKEKHKKDKNKDKEKEREREKHDDSERYKVKESKKHKEKESEKSKKKEK